VHPDASARDAAIGFLDERAIAREQEPALVVGDALGCQRCTRNRRRVRERAIAEAPLMIGEADNEQHRDERGAREQSQQRADAEPHAESERKPASRRRASRPGQALIVHDALHSRDVRVAASGDDNPSRSADGMVSATDR
jgi:copper oxidase (laccase) domain-containing protein